MALEHYKTQILLLHSEQSTLDSLSTGFSDEYSVHLATSGTEALNIFTETPVHVIVSAQDLPGMSGLDALREAKKRSPETIGILLAGSDQDDGLEALVGDKEVFQIVRGKITPKSLRTLIDSATTQARLMTLAESANDMTANVDKQAAEHIVMETSENGSSIISDGTGQMRALQPQNIPVAKNISSPNADVAAVTGERNVDILVLTKDEDFLATIQDSSRGMHTVHHCVTPPQAVEIAKNHKVGVLVTDAAMVGSKIEVLTERLRQSIPRLVAVVAGRRDDGELLMDLINRGQVYRFLLKPVSPGRARLAVEASIKHHFDGPEKAFKSAQRPAPRPVSAPKPAAKSKLQPTTKPAPKPAADPGPQPAQQKTKPAPISVTRDDSLLDEGLDDAFAEENRFAETITGLAATIGMKISNVKKSTVSDPMPDPLAITQPDMDSLGESDGFLQRPNILGIAVAVIIVAAGTAWFVLSSNESTPVELQPGPGTQPTVVESDLLLLPTTTVSEPAQTDSVPAEPEGILAQARVAVEAGRLISPAVDNAVELYVAALALDPESPVIGAELDAAVEQAFGMAESSLLNGNLENATDAMRVLQIASPDNSRLPFLTAQLSQMQMRSQLDEARLAIREGRMEDAGAAILAASSINGANTAELQVASDELAAARNAQQVDEVLALANSRLEQNQIILPTNDNARYFFELALSNDPDNLAARQGLTIVAGKLVSQARNATNRGRLTSAENLLRDARALAPASGELAAATTELANAKNEAARLAEEKRKAEEERIAAEAEQRRVAEEARIAEEQRLAEEQRIAEEQRVADQQRADEAAAAELAIADTPATETDSDTEIPTATTAAVVALKNSFGAPGIDSTAADKPPVEATLNSEPVQEPARDTGSATVESVAISTLARVNYVAPNYPRAARRRNLTGSVDIGFTVMRNGTVSNITVLDSRPGTVFNEAALDAVAEWRFEPSIENGERVEKKTAVRLAFKLE